MPRESEPLVDSTLDRELEGLLAVEPSPDFHARVRSAVSPLIVAPRWLPRRAWLLAPAGLGAVVLVAAIVLRPTTPVSPSEVLPSHSLQNASSTRAPVVSGATAGTQTLWARQTRSPRTRVAREMRVATQPAILISAQEAEGVRALLARTEPLHVRLVNGDGAATASPAGDIVALAVTSIVIEPLSKSEVASKGVQQ
jgi:hypothetical protein